MNKRNSKEKETTDEFAAIFIDNFGDGFVVQLQFQSGNGVHSRTGESPGGYAESSRVLFVSGYVWFH
jgi:hypothetical protein